MTSWCTLQSASQCYSSIQQLCDASKQPQPAATDNVDTRVVHHPYATSQWMPSEDASMSGRQNLKPNSESTLMINPAVLSQLVQGPSDSPETLLMAA